MHMVSTAEKGTKGAYQVVDYNVSENVTSAYSAVRLLVFLALGPSFTLERGVNSLSFPASLRLLLACKASGLRSSVAAMHLWYLVIPQQIQSSLPFYGLDRDIYSFSFSRIADV